MTVISMQQAVQDAQNAGFNGTSASIIAAIAMAESSLNSNAQHPNSDGTVDRGILQINSYWHSEVPDSCAYDIACSFKQAYRISNGGTSFTQWDTYKNGEYQQYVNGGNQNTTLYTTNTITNVANSGNGKTTLTVWGEAIAVFVMAVMLIFLGFYLMIPKQVGQTVAKIAEIEA